MTTCKSILTPTTKEPKICHALATTSAFNLKLCHIGKQSIKCPELQIHESKMETTKQERYLGYIITCDGKQDKNINSRIAKAWSYFAELRALMNEFPFGKRKTQDGFSASLSTNSAQRSNVSKLNPL